MPRLYFLTFSPEAPLDESLFARLPEDARLRFENITRPAQAKAAAMGHLLVRYALSREAGCRPGEITIERTLTGKPFSPGLGLEWNLSHTQGAAAVIVDGAPVGVDVERIGPLRRRVLEKAFSKREREYVLSGPEGQNIRFFEVWTRKESALKRSGRGLSKNLHLADAFSEELGVLTTMREGDYIVSACAETPIDAQSILRLDETALAHFFQNP